MSKTSGAYLRVRRFDDQWQLHHGRRDRCSAVHVAAVKNRPSVRAIRFQVNRVVNAMVANVCALIVDNIAATMK
jgi:hypothetical protein